MPIAAIHTLINCQCDQSRTAARTGGLIQSVVRTLRLWHARGRERRSFPHLSDRDLRDLRLSRWDVERELAKPFWRG